MATRGGNAAFGYEVITPPPGGLWRWSAWNRNRLVAGAADSKTMALCAVYHFLDPEGLLDGPEDGQS